MLYHFLFLLLVLVPALADAAIVQVGPTRANTTICAGVLVANVGDTLMIDSVDGNGNQIVYTFGQQEGQDPGCFVPKSLSFIGSGAKRAKITMGAGQNVFGTHAPFRPNVAGASFVFDNLEFADITCGDNCTGVWFEVIPNSVIFNNIYAHHCDNGLLISNESGVFSNNRVFDVTVTNSEFFYNGIGVYGQSHNVYVGSVKSLTFKYNYSHDSRGGQLLKSRAAVSYILYNRLADTWGSGYVGGTGASNYEADFPSGGRVFFIGNIVHQSDNNMPPGLGDVNQVLLVYCAEEYKCTWNGWSDNLQEELIVINNTFINDRANGQGIFVRNYLATPNQVIKNNIFAGPGTVLMHDNTAQANPSGNSIYTTVAAANFVNPGGLDWRLGASSTAIDAAVSQGVLPVDAGDPTMDTDPIEQYVHPLNKLTRTTVGAAKDNGALERTLEGTAYTGTVRAEARGGVGNVTIFWGSAVTEAASVTGYEVYRGASLLTTAAAGDKSYVDGTGTGGTAYTYTVIPKATPDGPVSNGVIGGSQRAPAATLGEESGWHYLSNTNFADTCTGTNCTYYWFYFAGAAYDPVGKCLYVWGGDGATHNSNEVYRFCESTNTWAKIRNASTTMGTGEFATDPNTDPGARRPYLGMTWMGGAINEFFVYGGYRTSSQYTQYIHRYKPATDTWTSHASGFTVSLPIGEATFNGTTEKVLYNSYGTLYEYTPSTQMSQPVKVTNVGYKSVFIYAASINKLFAIGEGMFRYYDPAAAYAHADLNYPCSLMKNTIYPVVGLDTARNVIVYWDRASTIVTLDLETLICTSETVVGGPLLGSSGDGAPGNGFQYSADNGGFWLPQNNGNMAFFRPTAGTPPPPPDPPSASGSQHLGGGSMTGGGSRQ